MTLEEIQDYVKLLSKYHDAFTWTYTEMPGLDPKIVVHHLTVRKRAKEIK